MPSLGTIVRLQVQPSRLTLGERLNRYYDPSALVAMVELSLTPQGVLACRPDGATLLDIHHTAHPETRNEDGINSLSVGFTRHYAAMRERYGEHVMDGCGGENILVDADEIVDLDRLIQGLAIQPASGPDLVWLHEFYVAHPCEPFSRYASRATEAVEIKQALQFLDNGLRGFYCALAQAQPATIAVGDRVFVPQR